MYVHDVTDPSYSRPPKRYTGNQSHSYYSTFGHATLLYCICRTSLHVDHAVQFPF